MKSKFWFSAVFVLGLSACGKNSSPAARGVGSEPLTGSLSENLENNFQSKYLDPCETADQKIKRKITADLDARAAAIEALPKSKFESKNWKVVSLGKTFVREKTNTSHPKAEWDSDDSENWAAIIAAYRTISDQPTDQNWIWLNGAVKSILMDDRNRLVYHANYNLDKDAGPVAEKMSETIAKCNVEPGCELPAFSEAESQLLQGNPIFQEKMTAVTRAKSLRQKKIAMRAFNAQVEEDLGQYRFTANSGVQRTSANEFVLPLDAGFFSDAQAQLAGYIESIWNKPNLALKIKWVDSDQTTELYKLFFEPGEGARSYVRRSNLSVHLYPYVRSTSIAHEIGHVLGLTDHYYTIWSPKKCGYLVQSLPTDLMSESTTGSVIEDEWKEIEAAYPVQP